MIKKKMGQRPFPPFLLGFSCLFFMVTLSCSEEKGKTPDPVPAKAAASVSASPSPKTTGGKADDFSDLKNGKPCADDLKKEEEKRKAEELLGTGTHKASLLAPEASQGCKIE